MNFLAFEVYWFDEMLVEVEISISSYWDSVIAARVDNRTIRSRACTHCCKLFWFLLYYERKIYHDCWHVWGYRLGVLMSVYCGSPLLNISRPGLDEWACATLCLLILLASGLNILSIDQCWWAIETIVWCWVLGMSRAVSFWGFCLNL